MSRPKRKAVDNTAQRAKKARGETDLADGLRWTAEGKPVKGVCPLLVLSSDTLEGRSKVAGFDIDFTVIQTASGRKFAVGSNDWEWWDDSVAGKLRALDKDGFRVVFFTNQAGIEKDKVKPDTVKDKIEAIIKELGIPVLVFISTGNSHYRKPSPEMWNFFIKNCNQGVEVDKSECVYVGDAAGRAKGWANDKPKDFSCSDRMFAANIGIKFSTPEEFFLDEKPAAFEWKSINPNEILKKATKPDPKQEFHKKGKELVVMVGCPASGKSTFRKRYLEPHGYVAVNRDTLGTAEKCIKVAKEALKSGKCVVADNTHPSVSARANFVQLAKAEGVPCRCFWMQTPFELAHHLNLVRQNQTNGEVRRIPDVGYNVFKKNFEEPTKAEGFTEIVKVNFMAKFDSTRDEEIFKQWTTAGH
ncbi:hypothetical protein BaRGS_00024655 [Batillaria attramentaria]|uniref:Bifunctional polynucleotide phosphatase/kinase n=1 Tax=Batillaria attramentaria TaxID=370345 RepID=A0ABD0KAB8_9CAEN